MVRHRSYEIANIFLTIQAIVAVLLIVGGIFGLFFGPDMRGSGQFAILGIIISIALKLSAVGSILGGLIMLALVQMARAHIHTAEMTWEMLELARKAERIATSAPSTGNRQGQYFAPAAAKVVSEKIDRSYLSSSLSTEKLEGNGKTHELFIFPGGKVRVVVGSAIMEFESRVDATKFLDSH